MSTVRMCDKCGELFSERQDGWQTFTARTVKKPRFEGDTIPTVETLDACPACSFQNEEVIAPVMAPTKRIVAAKKK